MYLLELLGLQLRLDGVTLSVSITWSI